MTKSITWTPKIQKLAVLKDWDKNPRSITGEALARLKQRITDRGFHDVVKIDTDNVILSGTQRRKALTELGITEVWTMVPDRKLTEKERQAVVVESNRNDGDWDWGKLGSFFDLQDLKDWGFGEDEIKSGIGLADSSGVDIDPDRMMLLTIVPPETPSLRDRAVIKFSSKEDYDRVKKAVIEGKIGEEELKQLV